MSDESPSKQDENVDIEGGEFVIERDWGTVTLTYKRAQDQARTHKLAQELATLTEAETHELVEMLKQRLGSEEATLVKAEAQELEQVQQQELAPEKEQRQALVRLGGWLGRWLRRAVRLGRRIVGGDDG